MPRVTLNDEDLDAAPGENLLALARRNASHIWFVCDGRGLCRTCECRVLSGSENLSPPSKIEKDLIGNSSREGGYRLACQSRVSGGGPVSVISVAEDLRRHAVAAVGGSEGISRLGSAGEFGNDLLRFALDAVLSFPALALHAMPQLISRPPDLEGIGNYLRDTGRIVERVIGES